MKEAERIARLRQVWLQRQPKENATENDVIVFYSWLEHNRPELLSRRHGDPYHNLKWDLRKIQRSLFVTTPGGTAAPISR